ncbi:transglycosylase SLT domain-containing protein [Methylocella tundrae]|uniref:transglycosylase SLT domain-containing protein n=1 Tax=Methylocella tundrae TaxID=227605 RepID=UPI001FCF0A76|nr:lytic transglycosylase domain-containing protein [Methylocella tundrae]WPP04736.1 lytic transglycosylase domain-containing protein [Methylocella tundrae]
MINRERKERARRLNSARETTLRIGLPALIVAALSIFEGVSFGAIHAWAHPDSINLCEREMTRAATKYDVPLGVLYAVGLTETGRRGALSPYALNIEGQSLFPANLDESIRRFESARKDGARLIDVGCMQINYYFHGQRFRSLEAMFDPRENVEYAAQYLKALRAREGNWTLAAARYHAGPGNNPAQKKYVCQVISNMVASGFGAWTMNARKFCQ